MSTTNTSGNWVKTWDRSGREIECLDLTAPITPDKQLGESTQNPSDKKPK